MTGPRIPLSRPTIGEAERASVLRVLESPHLALGPRTVELEERFTARLGVSCALVSSGTAGLLLALRALGVRDGEVLTPSYGFVATAHAIAFAGARPRFAEVDATSRCVSVETVAAGWRPSVRALLPVHVFGTPGPVDALVDWAREKRVPVIEDACEALGSSRSDRPIGTIGDVGVFAFYPNKQMTMGEGGLVVSPDAALVERVRSMRNQGRTGPGMQFGREGFNFRITELQAALGLAQLERLETLLARRATLADAYRRELAGLPLEWLPDPGPGNTRSWFAFPIFLRDRATRDRVRERLAEVGIESAPYFPALHEIPPYDDPALRAGPLPITEALSARGLALPFFPDLSDEQRREVVERVRVLLGADGGD